MTDFEIFERRFAKIAFAIIGIAVFCIFIYLFVFGDSKPAGAVTEDHALPPVRIWTDGGTGCQYLLTHSGDFMPRMTEKGRQICLPPTLTKGN